MKNKIDFQNNSEESTLNRNRNLDSKTILNQNNDTFETISNIEYSDKALENQNHYFRNPDISLVNSDATFDSKNDMTIRDELSRARFKNFYFYPMILIQLIVIMIAMCVSVKNST